MYKKLKIILSEKKQKNVFKKFEGMSNYKYWIASMYDEDKEFLVFTTVRERFIFYFILFTN